MRRRRREALKPAPAFLPSGFGLTAAPGPIEVSGSPGLRVSGSPGLRVSGSPGLRVSGSPGLRVSGSPGLRVSGSPGLRVSGVPQATSIACGRSRRLASPPESPSPAGHSGPDAPESHGPASTQGGPAARLRFGVRAALRRGFLLASLTCLSLLAVLAGPAAAQDVTFSSDVYRVTEGDAVTPELVLSHARSEDVTVHVESLGLGGPWDVTVPAGQTRQSFSIATSDDGKAAGSRVTLLLIAPSGHSDGVRRSPGGIADAVVTIEDKPSPPPTRISVTNPKISLWEGGTATIRVAIANPKPEAFTLDYTLSGISYSAAPFRASAADVVGGFGTRSITVPADATSVEIPIEIASDTTNAEGVEWFQVRLSTTASGVVFGEREVQVDIFDTYVYASFASASSRTNEQSRTHDVTVNLAAAPDKDITLRYSVNRVASTATADADYNYTALSGSVTVSAGATTATIPVTILDDSILEADETVVLTLTRGTGYELALDDNCAVTGAVHLPCQNQIVEHTLTIAANDGPTTVSFASASQKAVEGAGTRNVTVNLSHAPDADITLEYSVGGTATAGSDYTALSGTVTVSAGATTATIPVAIADDSDAEGEETVVLTLTGVEGLRKISPSTHTLTIAASDGPPPTTMASFAAASQSAGAETGTHNVTVNLNPAPTSNITLNYTMGGTATPDSDYTALSGTLAVSAGSAMATIPVTLLADNVQEDRETVVLTLTPGTGYELADPGKHTLTFGIVPTVSFLLPVAVTEEGVGTYEAPVAAVAARAVRRPHDLLHGGRPLGDARRGFFARVRHGHGAGGRGDGVDPDHDHRRQRGGQRRVGETAASESPVQRRPGRRAGQGEQAGGLQGERHLRLSRPGDHQPRGERP